MTKRLLIAMAMLFGAESTALACSCVAPPRDRAHMREMANGTAHNAIALVEVDVLSDYDPRTGRGELMRVRRTLAGRAPREFRIERRGAPQSAACELEYAGGQRAILLLYPAERHIAGERQYRDSGVCTSLFLSDPAFRAMLAEAMRGQTTSGPAPASPPASLCGSTA